MAKKIQNPEKKKCWDAFSKWWRTKRCIETTGSPVSGICITCGRKHHILYLDTGHCFAGRKNALLLTKKFIDIQCRYCNQILHGKPKKYRLKMVERYGVEFVDKWEIKLKHLVIQDKSINWERRTKLYKQNKQKLKDLQNER